MTTLGTPWAIGAAGVQHSAEVARLLAAAATGGAAGIIGTTDLKIRQLLTPGAGVSYDAGGAAMPNRYPGGGSQSYIGMATSMGTVDINGTPLGSGRSDLIIARIRDPQYGTYAGFNPENPNAFQFFTVEKVEGVPAGTVALSVAYPYIPLARIDIPANTNVITSGMIVDLREKISSKSKLVSRVVAPSGDMNAAGAYANWPSGTSPMVQVPSWATKMTMIANYSGIEVTGPVVVGTRGVLGTVIDSNNGIINKTATGGGRESYTHISEFTIPSSYRGSYVAFAVQAMKTSGAGSAQLDYQSTISYVLHFEEVPE